ncbi:MAG: HAD-IC family P-type ATPase [Patescibacteria group bacterium]|nr:HAD-IC family P-type ATPase [Patescibacteria group bacterium]
MNKDLRELEKNISWHSLEIKEVFKKLRSSEKGLSSEEVLIRQQEFGLNSLPSRKKPSFIIIFFRQFLSPLIYILILAGLVSLFLREWVDAIFIFVVIFFNSILGSWQENKAEKNAVALQKLLKIKAYVRRDELEKTINAENLVVGDLVFLESGDKVPADIRLFEAKNLQVDQSFLTGESEAVNKNTLKNKKDASVDQISNIVFTGSTVSSGRAWGVVIETGLKTEVGKIAGIVGESQKTKAPLIIRMEKFNKKISFIILFFCLFLAVVAIGKGIAPKESFFLVVALAVSAIPEGLPVAMTVALSVATTRMSRKNVIVRRLTAVEGLGSCTMIASDKTGTLTVNQQTAKLIYLSSGQELKVSGQGYNGIGEIEGQKDLSNSDKNLLERTIRSVVLANEGKLWEKKKTWYYHGDSMDIAFLALAYKAKMSIEKINFTHENLLEIPYESERRYSAKIFKNEKNEIKIAVKGSVEKILEFCSYRLVNGKKVKIDKKEFREKGIFLAEKGYRVLAVAEGDFFLEDELNLESFNNSKIKNLNLLSLICFIDPLREESRKAVEKCKQAGVKVVMITGDHPATALFIAKELGIAYSSKDVIVGEKLGSADTEIVPEFLQLVSNVKVFAGVSPLQKLKIVKALMSLGHFVAVTGDGVNDAPALKQANIGVAMGSGTDVAKETSAMIVADDNFSSIVKGIEEGRFAYDNVRKVIYFVISSGAAEIIIFILAIFLGMPLPLFAAQLLWLNVVTNGIQDISLSFERGEKGAMNRPPRSPQESVFDRLMVQQTLLSGAVIGLVVFFVWFYLIRVLQYPEGSARNIILMLMVLFQNLHVFNCRSEKASAFRISLKKNLILLAGVFGAHLLHVLATYNNFMQNVLGISPISFKTWIILFILASSVLWVMEIFKVVKRKKSF